MSKKIRAILIQGNETKTLNGDKDLLMPFLEVFAKGIKVIITGQPGIRSREKEFQKFFGYK